MTKPYLQEGIVERQAPELWENACAYVRERIGIPIDTYADDPGGERLNKLIRDDVRTLVTALIDRQQQMVAHYPLLGYKGVSHLAGIASRNFEYEDALTLDAVKFYSRLGRRQMRQYFHQERAPFAIIPGEWKESMGLAEACHMACVQKAQDIVAQLMENSERRVSVGGSVRGSHSENYKGARPTEFKNLIREKLAKKGLPAPRKGHDVPQAQPDGVISEPSTVSRLSEPNEPRRDASPPGNGGR